MLPSGKPVRGLTKYSGGPAKRKKDWFLIGRQNKPAAQFHAVDNCMQDRHGSVVNVICRAVVE